MGLPVDRSLALGVACLGGAAVFALMARERRARLRAHPPGAEEA